MVSTKCSQSFGDSLTTGDNFSGFKPLVRQKGWSLTMMIRVVIMIDYNDDDDEYDEDIGGGSEISLCETKAQLVLCHRHKGLGPPGQLVVGQVMVQAWAGDYQDFSAVGFLVMLVLTGG